MENEKKRNYSELNSEARADGEEHNDKVIYTNQICTKYNRLTSGQAFWPSGAAVGRAMARGVNCNVY